MKRIQILVLEALALQSPLLPTKQQEKVLFCFVGTCLEGHCFAEWHQSLASSYSHPLHLLTKILLSVRETKLTNQQANNKDRERKSRERVRESSVFHKFHIPLNTLKRQTNRWRQKQPLVLSPTQPWKSPSKQELYHHFTPLHFATKPHITDPLELWAPPLWWIRRRVEPTKEEASVGNFSGFSFNLKTLQGIWNSFHNFTLVILCICDVILIPYFLWIHGY